MRRLCSTLSIYFNGLGCGSLVTHFDVLCTYHFIDIFKTSRHQDKNRVPIDVEGEVEAAAPQHWPSLAA
jgi:hypothetical protein